MNNKVVITLILCITSVALVAIGVFTYLTLSGRSTENMRVEQVRKDKISSECMERTKTETVGMVSPQTYVNKDGDEKYCRQQMEK